MSGRHVAVMDDMTSVDIAESSLPFDAAGYCVLYSSTSGTVTMDGVVIPLVAGMPLHIVCGEITATDGLTDLSVASLKAMLIRTLPIDSGF